MTTMTPQQIADAARTYKDASEKLHELRATLLDPTNAYPVSVYAAAVRHGVLSRSEAWAIVEELYERDQLSELPTIWALVATVPEIVPPGELRRAVHNGTCPLGYALDGFKKLQEEILP